MVSGNDESKIAHFPNVREDEAVAKLRFELQTLLMQDYVQTLSTDIIIGNVHQELFRLQYSLMCLEDGDPEDE